MEDDIRQFLSLVAEGEAPVAAVQVLFDVSDVDAEALSKNWISQFKQENPFGADNLTSAILTKDGALKRLAVLAVFGDNEDTQRKAVMDIAKLQQWVDETPRIVQQVLQGSPQETERFLRDHAGEFKSLLESMGEPTPGHA